jgi:hypothetical protein
LFRYWYVHCIVAMPFGMVHRLTGQLRLALGLCGQMSRLITEACMYSTTIVTFVSLYFVSDNAQLCHRKAATEWPQTFWLRGAVFSLFLTCKGSCNDECSSHQSKASVVFKKILYWCRHQPAKLAYVPSSPGPSGRSQHSWRAGSALGSISVLLMLLSWRAI